MEIILKLAHWSRGRCCLKKLLTLKVFLFLDFYFWLRWPFCSAEWNRFSNFGSGPWVKHFCDIILKLSHWLQRRCRLKVFSSSGGHFVQRSRIISAILVQSYYRNICVKLFWNWLTGLGGDAVWRNCWRTDGQTTDKFRSQKLTLSTSCSGELIKGHKSTPYSDTNILKLLWKSKKKIGQMDRQTDRTHSYSPLRLSQGTKKGTCLLLDCQTEFSIARLAEWGFKLVTICTIIEPHSCVTTRHHTSYMPLKRLLEML